MELKQLIGDLTVQNDLLKKSRELLGSLSQTAQS